MTRSEFSEFVYESMVCDELERLKVFLTFHGLDDEIDDESIYAYARENVLDNMKRILSFYELGRKVN